MVGHRMTVAAPDAAQGALHRHDTPPQTSSADARSPASRELRAIDTADLRLRIVPRATLLLAVVCLAVGWPYLTGLVFRWRQCLFFFAVSAVALLAYRLRDSGAASPLALVGGAYALAWGGAALQLPLAPLLVLQVAVVLATTAAWPWAPPLAACGACANYAGIALAFGPQPALESAILAYLLSGALLYLATNSSHQILTWSWSRHAEAHSLAEQLRDRQEQLNHTVKALDVAYRLLQRTNHELAEARLEADEARRLKEQFAANISHELRTPLNVILGFSEIMHLSPHVYGDMEWTAALRRDVGQVYAASRHLLQLVDDVLDLSRLNAEAMPLRKQLVDIGTLVEEVAGTGRDLIHAGEMGERELAIETDLDSSVPRLYLDETRIREVILNLLTNSIRYTEQGRILLRTQRRCEDVLISVHDTGVGIPEHELESIFDEFHQAEAGSRQHGGIGLGLAISKRFVQLHGGRIWAESRCRSTETPKQDAASDVEEHGSTFYVSLPLGEVPAYSRLHVSQPAKAPANPYAESVVLCADSGAPAFDVMRLLARHLGGVEVLPAGSWEEAIDLAESHHSRAILHNLSLHDIRRFLAASVPQQARAGTEGPSCVVPVIHTAIPCAAWRAELMGVAGSLQKPVQREDLLALLAAIDGAEPAGRHRDILIVDDDRGFVQMLARMLSAEAAAYRVRWAYGGEEGLSEMRRLRPDVLILDLAMPDMTGAVVLATMRAEGMEDIPTIVVTALDVEQDIGGFATGCLSMAQLQGWSVGDTLAALQDLLARARPGWSGAPVAT